MKSWTGLRIVLIVTILALSGFGDDSLIYRNLVTASITRHII